MKTSNLLLIFLIIVSLIIGTHFVYDMIKYRKVPKGMVLVEEEVVDSLETYKNLADSLQIIANLPPDTVVKTDTIYKLEVRTVETNPEPTVEVEDFVVYEDELKVENEIDVAIEFGVKGELTTPVLWEYTPIVREIETIVEKKIPYPVLENIEVPVYNSGHYLSAAAGGNDKMFIFGIDYDYVETKYVYGFQYRRYGANNVYGVKVGINLSALIKR